MNTSPEKSELVSPLRLANPPIVEASLGFEFTSAPYEPVNISTQLADRLADQYTGPELGATRKVQLTPPPEPLSDVTGVALRFRSNNGANLVQLTRENYLYSRLAPYDSWPSFRDEARRVWELVQPLMQDPTIRSLSLRYINKISVPANEPIETFLKLYPAVPNAPDGRTQTITGGYMRLQIPLVELAGELIVQEMFIDPEHEGALTLVLDNDVQLELLQSGEQDVWTLLEQARDVKNQYFRHFLTDSLMETYK